MCIRDSLGERSEHVVSAVNNKYLHVFAYGAELDKTRWYSTPSCILSVTAAMRFSVSQFCSETAVNFNELFNWIDVIKMELRENASKRRENGQCTARSERDERRYKPDTPPLLSKSCLSQAAQLRSPVLTAMA